MHILSYPYCRACIYYKCLLALHLDEIPSCNMWLNCLGTRQGTSDFIKKPCLIYIAFNEL